MPNIETATCQHCGRSITRENGAWVDPNATGDDAVWRETCDSHDTFTAEHEPAKLTLDQVIDEATAMGLLDGGPVLYDADTAEAIGPATPAQIAASNQTTERDGTGIILIAADGTPVADGTWGADQPGVRRVYAEPATGSVKPAGPSPTAKLVIGVDGSETWVEIDEADRVDTPRVLMERFRDGAAGRADVDMAAVLWDILTDLRNTFRIAMAGMLVPTDAIDDIDRSVLDYLTNSYSDDEPATGSVIVTYPDLQPGDVIVRSVSNLAYEVKRNA